MTRLALSALVSVALSSSLFASDWPQYLGPTSDGVWPETGILREFPKNGPEVKWRMPINGGYSGPAVVGGKVYVTDRAPKPGKTDPDDPFGGNKAPVPSVERVLCFDAKTGKLLWKHEYDVTYQIQYPVGPRCTPTVSDGKVYTLGAMGNLFCLDATTGKVLWEKNFPKDFAVKTPVWGFAGHPVVYKNLLICLVGGEGSCVVAFDKDSGKEVWRGLSETEPGYNTPALIDAGGVTQLVVWTPTSLQALNPEKGTLYWAVPLKPMYGMTIMSPRKHGDYLYVAGIGNVAVTLKLDPNKPTVTEVWRSTGGNKPITGVYPVNMTPFIDNGVIYAADQPGIFRAVELSTGKRIWSSYAPVFGEEKKEDEFRGGASGTAFVTKNGDRFFLFNEVGELIIAKLTEKGYHEISKAQLLEPTTPALNGRKVVWSYPAYADKCVFLRNDREIICVSLEAK